MMSPKVVISGRVQCVQFPTLDAQKEAVSMKTLKKFWWAIPALVAALLAVFKGGSPRRGRAEKAQDEALEAKHEAIDAKADAVNERADHEAEVELGDLNGMSDDDLFRDALNRTRAERGGKG